MDRLREAWHNDLMLSMLSSFCLGLGLGVSLLALSLHGPFCIVFTFGVSLALIWSGGGLLSRADRLRAARWERREWR